MKKILSFILILILVVFSGCGLEADTPQSPQPTDGIPNFVSKDVYKPQRLGLYTDEEGTMMHDGKPFYGLGVNYYSVFNYAFTNKWNIDLSLSSLEVLANYGVKVIRFNLGGYFYSDYEYYFKREKEYLLTMDKIVNKAEELGIGLIPSFFWSDNISDYFDEPRASSARDDYSRSTLFRHEYVEKIVKRYAESPALYGWEYGNEKGWIYNLPNWSADGDPLPAISSRKRRTNEEDKMMYDDLHLQYVRFIKTVRDNDPHQRIIGNGDQSIREYAWNIYKSNDWSKKDTLAQQREILKLFNPDGMDAVSMHRYTDTVSRVNNPEKFYEPWLISDGKGGTTVLYDGWESYMTYLIEESSRLNKTCYVGEAGYSYNDATAADLQAGFTGEKIATVYEKIFQSAYKTKMPLTLLWNYDPVAMKTDTDYRDRSTGIEYSWNENWSKGKAILEKLKVYSAMFDEYIKG